jgi:2,3-bisphosphoglycerate-independent phosphoglycerate mutase
MTIGLGRIVEQDLVSINNMIENNSLKENKEWINFTDKIRKSGKKCHLMGLLSDGGVHSQLEHLLYFSKLLSDSKINVIVHPFLDGRDTPPQSSLKYLKKLNNYIKNSKNIRIGSVMGRFFAMDRDNRKERTDKAYECITKVTCKNKFKDIISYVENEHMLGNNDEFIEPSCHENYNGFEDGDHILSINFRKDRMRQIMHKFINSDVNIGSLLSPVSYDPLLDTHINTLIKKKSVKNSIGEVISKIGLKQLRIAETEKFAHVTYFLNGGIEEPFDGEDRILIPSPSVETYDLKPEMSANEVCEKLCNALESKKYTFTAVNFANADMVGHSGNLKASIKAVECIDNCLGKIIESCKNSDTTFLITADHGNVEYLYDEKNNIPYTSHTTNPVPFVVISNEVKSLKNGSLKDIATTALSLLNIKIPEEMTGEVLIN